MHQIAKYIPLAIRRSILYKSMLWLGLPILGLSGLSLIIGYRHAVATIKTQAISELRDYVNERSKYESQIFQLAQKNHTHLKPILLDEIKKARSTNPYIAFNALMKPWSDTTYRNFDQTKPLRDFDTLRDSTVFIGSGVALTQEFKQEILVFHQLSTTYGRGWQTSFMDLWIASSSNAGANYWNGTPWALYNLSDLDMTKEEYGTIANKTNNPSRTPRWTGIYFDPSSKQWVVSLVTPVDDENGRHIATIGHDIMLNGLINRTQNDVLPGTHNLIITEGGRLIIDRNRTDAIQKAHGQLTIDQLKDSELTYIWQQSKSLKENTSIIDSPDKSKLIAITHLAGTDWYFVTLYPKQLLYNQAVRNIIPLLILSICLVSLEILFIYFILLKQVNQPLQQLLKATQKLAKGQFDVTLDIDRIDEVGNLSRSFTDMAQDLQTSFAQLNLQNETLESQVTDRTEELTTTLNNLKLAQGQLVQSEKMSGLGQMVAGIAHEINNPINFIHGNLNPATQYIKDLLHHLHLYQQKTEQTEIDDHAEEVDLEFLEIDLPKLLNSMNIGTERIREIILSLRNFSRLDEAELKTVNLHEGIDSTLLILNHRFKQSNSEIVVKKDYGAIGKIDCYPSQLNQVIMNLLANSIDALQTYTSQYFEQVHPQRLQDEDLTPWKPTISITTISHSESVEIIIYDNGPGIPETVRDRIFDPFFTTKAIGKGTGLGLSISHSIIVERHEGSISCESNAVDGTTFRIKLPLCQGLESSSKSTNLQQPIGALK
jgi:two-component system NtrC family sensor kinase